METLDVNLNADSVALGVNIDHVATLRNARRGAYPSVLRSVEVVKRAGAHLLTLHLREDRRHIKDEDVAEVCSAGILPVNLEIAPTSEMLEISKGVKAHSVCLVPEGRNELTTEGGLDVLACASDIEMFVDALGGRSEVSLFIEPDQEAVRAANDCGASIVELHTGKYANLSNLGIKGADAREAELKRLFLAAELACKLGLEVHAGHGLTYDNISPLLKIKEFKCFNIGHFLIAESIFVGLEQAVGKMLQILHQRA